MDPTWDGHGPKPVSIHVIHAPHWEGRDSLHAFLYWHGSVANLRRILRFVRGKPRRDVATLQFDQSQVIDARVDTRARTVTFLSPGDEEPGPMTLGYDEVVPLLQGYVDQGGVPGRAPDD